MIKRFLILILLITIAFAANAQKKEMYLVNIKIQNGDTIPFIKLREVIIFPPKVFKNKRDAKRYRRLARKVRKVLPYARIARVKLDEIQAVVDTLPTDRARRKFINEKDKELKEEFEGKLRKFTVSEGIILIKLIDRETGDSSYKLIQELKGNFTAFMWQAIARLFGSNLKLDYDPKGNDKLIEEIVLRIDNGQL